MNSEEFQNLARLYVVGALDEVETLVFETERRELGEPAEVFIQECRRLNAAFALTLKPRAPREDAKEKLMSLVKQSLGERGNSKA